MLIMRAILFLQLRSDLKQQKACRYIFHDTYTPHLMRHYRVTIRVKMRILCRDKNAPRLLTEIQ